MMRVGGQPGGRDDLGYVVEADNTSMQLDASRAECLLFVGSLI